MPLPPIDDFNTFPDKTSGGNPAVSTDVVSAQDLNRIKLRMSENRTQANLASNPSDTAPAALGATAAAGAATAYSRGDHVHPRPTAAQVGAAPLSPTVITITDADSPFMLLAEHAGRMFIVDEAPEIVVSSELYAGAAFLCYFHFLIAGSTFNAAGTIEFELGTGVPETNHTIEASGLHVLVVASPTSASLLGTSATNTANTSSFQLLLSANRIANNALRPLASTPATNSRTLIIAEAGELLRVSGPAVITIPAGLFMGADPPAQLGNRAFRAYVLVEAVPSGAVTFVGSGGLDVSYAFKDPGISPYQEGDLLEVLVLSATVALVRCLTSQDVSLESVIISGLETTSTLVASGLLIATESAQFLGDTSFTGAVRVGTEEIADSRALGTFDSGKTLFCDTSGGAITLTVGPQSGGWHVVVVRVGPNSVTIVGSDMMTMFGPASSGGSVTIAVDGGGVSLIQRSVTQCWTAGVVS